MEPGALSEGGPASGQLRGRTVLVTGASSGIGLAGARALASRGANLWLLCRDAERAEAAAAACRAEGGGGSVQLLLADLSSQQQVRGAAKKFRESGEPLHVLVNNAGAVFFERTLTVDGIESTLAVNHLAPFLLTDLLLPCLRASAPARIVNVSSAGHRTGRIRLGDLGCERRYTGFGQYANTKLANVLFTRELARRLAGTGVVVHCLHPGAVNTGLGMNNTGWFRNVWEWAHPLMRSADKGARTLVHLASAPEVEERTGDYWSGLRPKRPSKSARDEALAAALWRASEEMVGLSPAGSSPA